jgi:hypothetical protein
MISKKHRMILFAVAIQLLIVAIVCYAAFPMTAPEKPIRLVYYTTAGKVLFDHQAHASIKGYGLACADCHHMHGKKEIQPVSCGLCHPPLPADNRFPESCMDCHKNVSEFKDTDIMKRTDAFHAQCIGCHEQFGKGPQSGPEECSKCHVR